MIGVGDVGVVGEQVVLVEPAAQRGRGGQPVGGAVAVGWPLGTKDRRSRVFAKSWTSCASADASMLIGSSSGATPKNRLEVLIEHRLND